MITLAFVFNNLFFWAWSTWLPTYLTSVRTLPPQMMGNVTTLIYTVSLITIFGSAYLSDRFDRRAVFGASGFIIGAVAVFIAVITQTLALAIVFLVMGLMFQQVGALMIQPLLHRAVSKSNISRATGVQNFFAQCGAFLSPFLVGTLIQLSGGNYFSAFTAMAICLALASLSTAVLIRHKY